MMATMAGVSFIGWLAMIATELWLDANNRSRVLGPEIAMPL